MRTTFFRSLLGAITIFALAACGVGETDNTDDGVGNNPPDCNTSDECGGSTTPETIGAVENLTADRVDPIVNLTWGAADNALGYQITRINGAEVDLGLVANTSFEDMLPADHIGVPVRYRVTPIGVDGLPGPSSEVMTQPNTTVEDPPVEDPPVEDPPPTGEWLQPGQEEAVRTLVGRSVYDTVVYWNGLCNGEQVNLQISVPAEPVMISDGIDEYTVHFYATDDGGAWSSMNVLVGARSGKFMAIIMDTDSSDHQMEYGYFNNFSANPADPWFYGGFNKRTEELANPPCRFTPAPEDPGN